MPNRYYIRSHKSAPPADPDPDALGERVLVLDAA